MPNKPNGDCARHNRAIDTGVHLYVILLDFSKTVDRMRQRLLLEVGLNEALITRLSRNEKLRKRVIRLPKPGAMVGRTWPKNVHRLRE